MRVHDFPPFAWRCALCGASVGSIDAKLSCLGSAAEPAADPSPDGDTTATPALLKEEG